MARMRTAALALAALAVISAWGSGSAYASYIESDYPGDEVVISPPRRPPIYVPPVRIGNEVRRLLSRVTVGGPYHYRGLAVYPLYVRDPSVRSYLSADEALSRGLLVVSEHRNGTVRRLYARNRSTRPVFVMQGLGFSGGKQNRVAAEDVLLAPGAEGYIPVYCMEERRWGRDREVGAAKMLAPEAVRRSAAAGATQRELWRGVDAALDSAGARSETRDLSAALESSAARKHVAGYVDYFRRVPRRGLAGGAVARWGRLTSIDVFESEHLAREHWEKILTSSSFELMSVRRSVRWPRHPGTADVRRMLRAAYDARMSSSSGPVSGGRVSISGSGVSGSACTWRGEAVHVSLWGRAPIMPPMPEPMPLYGGHGIEEERF